jgi:hypothetical protein
MKKLTRMETNKEARRVLNRHGVDLSYCSYSCAGTELRMTGWLRKHDGSEFNGAQIESLIIDFKRCLPGMSLAGDLDNWKFSTDHISFIGEKGPTEKGSGMGDENQERYEIDLDDYDL